MQITIGAPLTDKNPRNAYVLYVNLMHGDADAYSTIKFGPYVADDDFEVTDLEARIKVLKKMDGVDSDTFKDWDDFRKLLSGEWPSDTTCDDYLASYEDHYVRFFDKNGVEFQTKVTL